MPRGHIPELTPEKVTDALWKYYGNLHAAGKALKTSFPRLHAFVNADPQLRQVMLIAREQIVEEAEFHLIRQIRTGNMRAITFALERLGKTRGYNYKVDVTIDQDMRTRAEELAVKYGLSVDEVLEEAEKILHGDAAG